MNICFYLAAFTHGGIGRIVSILCNELKKRTDHHIMALCHSNIGREDIYHTDFPVTYIYHSRKPVSSAMLKDGYIGKVKAFLKENDVDLLIVCDELFYPAAVIAGKKIRVWCWFHTSPYISAEYRFQKEGRHFGFKRCDSIIAITDKTKEILQKKYPKKKIYRIYNAVDEALFEKQRDYQPDAMKIISVGRLCYQKNFQRLIRIAAAVKEKSPGLQWHIYGEGEDRPELERMISENHLEETVVLMGQCPDLYHRYNDYSAIVMTSRYEGFPMTLVEASACGLPMISFDVFTGPSEIIEDGTNGFLCPDADEEAMENRILRLFSDRELRLKMSEESRASAQELRLDRIAPQWIALIDG